MRRRLRSLTGATAPLALLLAVATVLALVWMVAQPPFQGPDEEKHYAYVERIVEQGEIPWKPSGNCFDCGSGLSTALQRALLVSGTGTLQGNPAMKDVAGALDERAWEAAADALPPGAAADGRFVSTLRNGPAYYLYEAIPYAAADGIFDRAFLMRLWNLPFVLALVGSAWVLAGLVLGPRRWLQALAAGIVALNAQLMAVGGSINADIMLAALYAVGFVVMALVLLRGPSGRRIGALVALTALAALTHPRGLPLLAPAAATLLLAWWRATAPHGAPARRRALAALAAGGVVAVVAIGWAATRGRLSAGPLREFSSYLWQFYLPRLEFMTPTTRADWDWREVFVDRVWGIFAQFDVVVAPWVMDVMAVVTVVGLAALVAVLIARRRSLARVGGLAAVLVLAFATYLLALHVGAWRTLSGGSQDPVLTGRYFLPFIGLVGLAAAVLVSWLPRRLGALASAALLTGAVALHAAALGALVTRFQVA